MEQSPTLHFHPVADSVHILLGWCRRRRVVAGASLVAPSEQKMATTRGRPIPRYQHLFCLAPPVEPDSTSLADFQLLPPLQSESLLLFLSLIPCLGGLAPVPPEPLNDCSWNPLHLRKPATDLFSKTPAGGISSRLSGDSRQLSVNYSLFHLLPCLSVASPSSSLCCLSLMLSSLSSNFPIGCVAQSRWPLEHKLYALPCSTIMIHKLSDRFSSASQSQKLDSS